MRYKISGSHVGVSEDLGLLGFDAVSLCESFQVFLRSVMPSSSGRQENPEEFFWNHLITYSTAQHPYLRTESSSVSYVPYLDILIH